MWWGVAGEGLERAGMNTGSGRGPGMGVDVLEAVEKEEEGREVCERGMGTERDGRRAGGGRERGRGRGRCRCESERDGRCISALPFPAPPLTPLSLSVLLLLLLLLLP